MTITLNSCIFKTGSFASLFTCVVPLSCALHGPAHLRNFSAPQVTRRQRRVGEIFVMATITYWLHLPDHQAKRLHSKSRCGNIRQESRQIRDYYYKCVKQEVVIPQTISWLLIAERFCEIAHLGADRLNPWFTKMYGFHICLRPGKFKRIIDARFHQ